MDALRCRNFCFVVIAALLGTGTTWSGAPDASQESGKTGVEGVHFSVSGGTVLIGYELIGDPAREYKIDVVLSRRTDTTFRYSPKSLTGDIGVGRFAGKKDKIVWAFRDEFPEGLQGSDYFFEVHAEQVGEASGPSVGTVLGVGAAVVGVTATYFLVSGMHTAKTATPVPDFPQPPGRPK